MGEIRTITICFLLVGIVLMAVGITAVTTPKTIPEASADAELVSYDSHEEYDNRLKTLVYYDPADPVGKSTIVDCEHDWEHNDSKLGIWFGIFATITGILLLVSDVMHATSKRREREDQAPPSVAP